MSEPRTNGGTPPGEAAPQGAAATLDVHHLLRAVRTSGSSLVAQAALHLQLLRIEWAEERGRLRKLVVATLAGFAFLLALLGAVSALWLALFWDTRYRVPAAATLVALFAIGLGLAWQRCQSLLRQGEQSFADSRRELAADFELLGKPR